MKNILFTLFTHVTSFRSSIYLVKALPYHHISPPLLPIASLLSSYALTPLPYLHPLTFPHPYPHPPSLILTCILIILTSNISLTFKPPTHPIIFTFTPSPTVTSSLPKSYELHTSPGDLNLTSGTLTPTFNPPPL